MYGDFWKVTHAKYADDPVTNWIEICEPSEEQIDLIIHGLLIEHAAENTGAAGNAIIKAIMKDDVEQAIRAHAWFMNVDGENMAKFDLDYLRDAWFDEEDDEPEEEDDEDEPDDEDEFPNLDDMLEHSKEYSSFIDFLNLVLEHPQAFINWRNSKELKPFEEFAKDDDPDSEENQMLKIYMGILSAGALEELREK